MKSTRDDEQLPPYPASQPKLVDITRQANEIIARDVRPRHPWRNAIDIAERCELGEYGRSPELFRLYRHAFFPAVHDYFPSMEACLLSRLGWLDDPEPPLPPGMQSFSADLSHPAHVRVVVNDWPYGVEKEVTHYVIWTRLPIFHPSQHPTPANIEHGYSGFSWRPERDSPAARQLGRFVRQRWPVERYLAIYFANPPSLQSIRGVSHFHALVKAK